MASSKRDEISIAEEVGRLLERAPELGFFRLVALVERMCSGSVRVGGDGPFLAEALRFRHDPSLTFNPSDITRASVVSREPLQVEVTTSFLGLTGSASPLPVHISEELLDEEGGATQRAFLDLFHHRLLSLLYRGVIKYQLASEATGVGSDAWVRRLLSLAGVDAVTQRETLDHRTVLMLMPALVSARRSPSSLASALRFVLASDLRGANLDVEPFVGEWVVLDERDRCRLGSRNSRLGMEMVLGARVFDVASRFRIKIGPVDSGAFRQLAAGTPLRAKIDAVVALFVNDWLTYEVAVTVDETRMRLFLSSEGDGPRLGVDAWLGQYDRKTASVRMRGGQNSHVVN
jgi:type VI secretion system protein ImpH